MDRDGQNPLSANNRFLYRLFRRYYRQYRPVMPDRYPRREFGFIPF